MKSLSHASVPGSTGRSRRRSLHGVVLVCRRFAVHAERETLISLVRGLVQMARHRGRRAGTAAAREDALGILILLA